MVLFRQFIPEGNDFFFFKQKTAYEMVAVTTRHESRGRIGRKRNAGTSAVREIRAKIEIENARAEGRERGERRADGRENRHIRARQSQDQIKSS